MSRKFTTSDGEFDVDIDIKAVYLCPRCGLQCQSDIKEKVFDDDEDSYLYLETVCPHCGITMEEHIL